MYRDIPTDVDARKRVDDVYDVLSGLNDDAIAERVFGAIRGGKFRYLRYNLQAQDVFEAAFERINKLAEGAKGNELLEQHFLKYDGLIAKLSLIFHLINVADKKSAPGPITKEAAEMALAWIEFLTPHALRIYGMVSSPEWRAAHALIDGIKKGKFGAEGGQRSSGRNAGKHQPPTLRTAAI